MVLLSAIYRTSINRHSRRSSHAPFPIPRLLQRYLKNILNLNEKSAASLYKARYEYRMISEIFKLTFLLLKQMVKWYLWTYNRYLFTERVQLQHVIVQLHIYAGMNHLFALGHTKRPEGFRYGKKPLGFKKLSVGLAHRQTPSDEFCAGYVCAI